MPNVQRDPPRELRVLAIRDERYGAERLHSLFFIGLGIVVLAINSTVIQVNPAVLPLIAAAVILLLGVPHGGFDVAVWRHRQGHLERHAVVRFLVLYISLAGASFVFWVIAPEFALPVFLAMSAYHFSNDWKTTMAFLPRCILAAALITGPAVFFSQHVTEIFNWLAPNSVAEKVTSILRLVGPPVILGSLAIVGTLAWRAPLAALEIGVVLALALLAHPVVFFVVYFCGLHSPRHTLDVYRELQPASAWSFFKAAWPYAPLAILATLAGALALSSLPVGPATLGTVFMALGVLTVPHMLLIERSGPHTT